MYKTITLVFLGILLLAYGSCFFAWNLTPQEITAWQLFGVRYSQVLPVGSLAFFGVVIGALVMAIAAVSGYATQRGATKKAAATIRKAKEKLQAQLDTINDLRGQVAQLQDQVASLQAGDGTWGKATYPAEAEAAGGEAPAADKPAQDDDVI